MKFDKDDKYIKIGIVTFLTVVAIYIACNLLGNIPTFLRWFVELCDFILDISWPIILAFVIAYLLLIPTTAIENFLLSRKHVKCESRGLARSIGIIVSYLTVIAVIFATVIGIYYMIGGQLSENITLNNMYNSIVTYFKDETLSADSLRNQLNKWHFPFTNLITSKIDTIAEFLTNAISGIISYLFDSAISLGGNLFNIFIAFILSIYFIFSHEYFTRFVNKIYYMIFRESHIGKSIRENLRIINYTFSSYIRGQLIEAFIVAVLSSIVLYIIGVDYAVVIGIITGICNLVPYIGPLIGTILSGVIALLGGNVFTCIEAIIGMQIIQQLDANVICPRVVGNIVGLPSAFVIIAILIGGNYAGLLGMLVAVPVAASLKEISGRWYNRHFSKFNEYYENIELESATIKEDRKEAHEAQKQERKKNRKETINKIKPFSSRKGKK